MTTFHRADNESGCQQNAFKPVLLGSYAPLPAQLPDQPSCRISSVAGSAQLPDQGCCEFGNDANAVPMVFLAHGDRNALVTIRQVRFLRRNSFCWSRSH